MNGICTRIAARGPVLFQLLLVLHRRRGGERGGGFFSLQDLTAIDCADGRINSSCSNSLIIVSFVPRIVYRGHTSGILRPPTEGCVRHGHQPHTYDI